jgi:hypothetical protein
MGGREVLPTFAFSSDKAEKVVKKERERCVSIACNG